MRSDGIFLSKVQYSSSINKITTTNIPNDWERIDFEPLKKIGFSFTHLHQLLDSHMTTPEIVQDSIQHFSHALENNDKVKAYKDPLNVLMGVLRKGQRWYESNYIPPQELALRQILEETRKRKESVNSMLKELIDLEFPEWRRKISNEDISKIVPAETLKSKLSPAIDSALRHYFVENIILPRLKSQSINIDR
jgi:hypothetical protein